MTLTKYIHSKTSSQELSYQPSLEFHSPDIHPSVTTPADIEEFHISVLWTPPTFTLLLTQIQHSGRLLMTKMPHPYWRLWNLTLHLSCIQFTYIHIASTHLLTCGPTHWMWPSSLGTAKLPQKGILSKEMAEGIKWQSLEAVGALQRGSWYYKTEIMYIFSQYIYIYIYIGWKLSSNYDCL